ncbi:MAG: hypothetical protein IIT57_14690, partial [Treponema sp.]|nr:hypothetical protein [Treponema sp.]
PSKRALKNSPIFSNIFSFLLLFFKASISEKNFLTYQHQQIRDIINLRAERTSKEEATIICHQKNFGSET